jgi:hypothetical protein
MRLEFLNVPTRDPQASVALYRDELGWEEAWREGDSTVSLRLPGSDVQLMLVAGDGAESAFGPLFVLDDGPAIQCPAPRWTPGDSGAAGDPRRLPRHVRGSLRKHHLRHGPVARSRWFRARLD